MCVCVCVFVVQMVDIDADVLRFDRLACGSYEVGRHAQVCSTFDVCVCVFVSVL